MSDRNTPTPRGGRIDSDGRMHQFIESFDALALAGKKSPQTSPARPDVPQPRPSGGGFVGGFLPALTPPGAAPSTPQRPPRPPQPHGGATPPLPRPPAMPMPQHAPMSRTMQMARNDPPPTPPKTPRVRLPPSMPALVPPVPPHRPHSDPTPSSPVGATSRTPQPAKLAPPPMHRRAQSVPLSPTTSSASSRSDSVSLQCKAMTIAGKRCRKMVKVSSPRADTGGDVFCHQHEKKLQEPSGFYSRKTGDVFIEFKHWIPSYLHPSTQATLRAEMQKAKSESDVDGYIYTFEIRDPDNKDVVHLKVGRATNLTRRMDQWGKQCGSKEQILRGFWPGGVHDQDATLMKGLVQAGPKGRYCHRVERLVHIELADLAANTPYLDADYPNTVNDGGQLKHGATKTDIKLCPDCGKAHKEIFSFERAKQGRYKGKEWEVIVKPVIEKWGGFVEAYL